MKLALPARAKLNLDLEVVGRRDDGFHELRTTMQTIELHDLLIVEVAAETTLEVSGMKVGVGDNSVLKAQAALERASRTRLPAKFHVHKRIPPGSGMGGASSDAAAALKALKALFALDVDLFTVAPDVGSDVPFFIGGGRALVEGRGDRVTSLPPNEAWFAIAWPGIELSTQKVYEEWDRSRGIGLRDAAERVEPRLKAFAERLGDGWRMTGSGSAFFKATNTYAEAKLALNGLDGWKTVSRTDA